MITIRNPRKKQETAILPNKPELPYEKLCVSVQLQRRATDLYLSGKYNQHSICNSAAKSVDRFGKNKGIKCVRFSDVTSGFLRDYEHWMLREGKLNKSSAKGSKGTPASMTTVSIYCEAIRYVFRQAIEAGVAKQSAYPFGNGKFTIATVSNSRQPRSKDEIKQIMDYQPENEKEAFFRDLFVFSFLCNGCNIKDLLNLKRSDVDMESKTFSFVREKSKNTSRSKKKQVEGILFDQTIEIINRWSDASSNYLFPVLNDRMSAMEKEDQKKYVILQVNRHIQKIADQLGMKGKVTTYTSRHSFANTLMQAEVPLAMISASLGHSRISTTEIYLGRFSSDKKREYLQRLL